MEGISLCPPKIITEDSSVYSSPPPNKEKEKEEDSYLRNIHNLKNLSSILGPGKWIINGCQESNENNTKYILPGTIAIISQNDEIDLISVAKQKYFEFCHLENEKNDSYSIIRNLIFSPSKSKGDNYFVWNEFQRIGKINEIMKKYDELNSIADNLKNEINILKQNQIPKGGIIMWSGNNVPSGFALCDGKNGTPNLVNKFIIGSGGNYKLGAIGGNEKIKLNVNQLPPHNHSFTAWRINDD